MKNNLYDKFKPTPNNLSLGNPGLFHFLFLSSLGLPGFRNQDVGSAPVHRDYQQTVQDKNPKDPSQGFKFSPFFYPFLVSSDRGFKSLTFFSAFPIDFDHD